ncbi:MAG: SH3 domain-containing protein [Deltaproteobacteria bacterium]|nr:SH3 domain-containing protein [Deltaproteobacteria bacterium]
MKESAIILYSVLALFTSSWLEASPVRNDNQNYAVTNASVRVSNGVYKADFWVERLDNPDKPILTPEQIVELNKGILDENDEMANVSELEGAVSKQRLTDWLLEDPIPPDRQMFDRRGRPLKEAFYRELMGNMNLEGIRESNELIFGVIARRADIRAFPTDEPVLKSPSAKDFDVFQYSAIYPPQPVALLHKSKDEKWGFFQTPFVRGWIKMADVVFAMNRDDIKTKADKSLVITGSKVKVFKKQEVRSQKSEVRRKTVVETVPMGTTLVLQGEDKNRWLVKVPEKDKDGLLVWTDAYIEKRADVHIGPLSYTKQNVIKQAFKALGEGYGWGGRKGLRDCSSFIQDVFATMGINLPRNSSRQAAVGKVLMDLEESASPDDIKKALDLAVPGITLFGLNGHIMLYLGNINGNYYTLHQFFGYRDKDGFRTVNKAVVTNLELGKGSKMGPIWERIKSVNLVIPDGVN